MSGIVEEIGEACQTDVQKGDRVYGVCHGANNVCLYLSGSGDHAHSRLEQPRGWRIRSIRHGQGWPSC